MLNFLKLLKIADILLIMIVKLYTSFSFQNKTRQKGLQSKCRPMLSMLASVCCYFLFATKKRLPEERKSTAVAY